MYWVHYPTIDENQEIITRKTRCQRIEQVRDLIKKQLRMIYVYLRKDCCPEKLFTVVKIDTEECEDHEKMFLKSKQRKK